jgi:hypothetical protein
LCLITFQQAALAGPPLICHSFEIGNARSLPWSGEQWRAINKTYNVNRLVEDTLGLLTPETPVLVRMETLRRATVYALMPVLDISVNPPARDAAVANELLTRLRSRVPEPGEKSDKKSAAIALFDYGYLIESYKQAGNGSQGPKIAGGIDGHVLIVKAIAARGGDPEMELAAALACAGRRRESGRDAYIAHLQRSAAGAREGSLLARNLLAHFGNMGTTLAEIRANAGTAKN